MFPEPVAVTGDLKHDGVVQQSVQHHGGDDIAYFRNDQPETRLPFELISSRYENRSLLITANQLLP